MQKDISDTNGKVFLYKDEGYNLLGACFSVYKEMGNGYLESVYQECLAIEFENLGIPFIQKPSLQIKFRDVPISQHYIPDFVCYDKIIVELKSVSKICDEHRSQLFNYLKITGFKVGYIINFGHYPLLEHERFTR